ncbi:hypothetical protein [Azospirillum argentinense]|uniref:Capsid protein n=1 Tax=Azospirillum brasilense TaxID=192 RepID=A0A4D8QAS7_AZOBR|nr:hypothetical protein [Azospirillum argentinense]QCO07398.1 hypothetical protein D3867_36610 [Azospirillum argentinense]
MALPNRNMMHVEKPLANLSIAYMQSADNFVFNKIFPTCPVEKETDKYYVFDIDSFMRGRARRRADGTESSGGGFKTSTDSYDLTDPYAHHKPVTQRERDNSDSQLELDQTSVDFVMSNILITAEEDFLGQYFKTGVWGQDKVGGDTIGKWDDYASSNPIEDIDTARLWIWQNTGRKPNTLTVHPTVHARLKNHPLILDRFDGKAPNEAGLAALFEVERYLQAGGVHRTGPEGDGEGNFIAGKHALLSFAPHTPALKTPSCGYTFALRGTALNGVEKGVRMARIPTPLLGLNSERIEGELFINWKVTGQPLGYFFADMVV